MCMKGTETRLFPDQWKWNYYTKERCCLFSIPSLWWHFAGTTQRLYPLSRVSSNPRLLRVVKIDRHFDRELIDDHIAYKKKLSMDDWSDATFHAVSPVLKIRSFDASKQARKYTHSLSHTQCSNAFHASDQWSGKSIDYWPMFDATTTTNDTTATRRMRDIAISRFLGVFWMEQNVPQAFLCGRWAFHWVNVQGNPSDIDRLVVAGMTNK